MGTVAAALRTYTALRNALPSIIRQTMEQNKAAILLINKEQLKKGQSSTGGKFKPYKNKAYAKKKNALNALPGLMQPDLMLKQDFVKGLKIEVSGNILTTVSSDEKGLFLEKHYIADLIYGLTEKNKSEFITNTLRPHFIRNIKLFLNQ